jgi:hypothetical protein
MPESPNRWSRTWGWSWLALTGALAFHVADEAANDFLGVYNPTVRAIRARFPFLPFPTFTFAIWLTGLILAVVVLAALSVFVFRGRRAARYLAWPYGVFMFVNGLQHIAGSVYMRRLMPGVISSPLLLATSVALLIATRRVPPVDGGTQGNTDR